MESRSADYQVAQSLPADGSACPAVAWMCDQIRRHAGQTHWARLQSAPLQRAALDGRVSLALKGGDGPDVWEREVAPRTGRAPSWGRWR